ncbi:uncharacterized protein B0P05DRAFT_530086 [Gilbertella persicaria]|uniref:HD/PDEase domain-containing protein n=1 Tax=Rhizopus stolonifer TaxID=4846 RepID=A0A367KPB1_RHIST|nr:uncharacterized protein B0P05DRAFT_530086 [Gilbertella persicaria]KAI8090267.1 hypothetical protein B0P05DRAFT_530086 [Gilbertella persicaria]RCI03692.1 hypothetical protein CU098_008675 [Rhizopus stolonifer]
MVSYSDVLNETRKMVSEYMSGFDSSHDMYHVDRVVDVALAIANDLKTSNPNLDLELVELAALCHDVGDRKYYQGKETGGQMIQTFLQAQNYPKAQLVARIVDNIGFSKELGWNDECDDPEQVSWRNHCLELHAVQDADKLDAIGAFGILRCAAFSGAKNRPLYVPDHKPIENITQEQYLSNNATNSSAITHFHEKLFKLKSMMRTPKGKALAVERDQFMQLFVQQIEKEFKSI